MKAEKTEIFFIINITFIILLVFGCDFSPYEGEATVSIDLQKLLSSGSDSGGSDASRVAGVPANINQYIKSITITISGPGMNEITRTYSPGMRYISITVPPGNKRTIKLELNINPNSPLAVFTFGGETTINLKPGKIAVDIPMAPTNTKIVIPDRASWGGPIRLVQIPDMTPAPAEWQSISVAGNNYYDVDFDAEGIIYVANEAADPDVIRINSLSDTNPGDISDAGINSPIAIAVDKLNHLVYYGSGNVLRRSNLDGSGQTTITNTIASIRGLAIDEEDNILYVVGNIPGANPAVFRYDLSNSTSTSVEVANSQDVIVKDNYIYITCLDNKIWRYTKDLTGGNSFGVAAAGNDDRAPGHFYCPTRFVAILNKKFYIIDDGGSGIVGAKRIVAFDELGGSWSGWQVFRASDIGQSDFRFYNC
jgi:hypothetical protein